MAIKAFVDSDVVISSLMSSRGAAYWLIHHTDTVELIVSDASVKELKQVVKRLDLSPSKLQALLDNNLSVISLNQSQELLQQTYTKYVMDPNDVHVVAGTVVSKAQFLVSYNLKHFKPNQIKEDLNVIIMTPATFLQYLRSKN